MVSQIWISLCNCLAVTGINDTKSLNLKTISVLLTDWLSDNILELSEEARLLVCNFKTVRKVESRSNCVPSYSYR